MARIEDVAKRAGVSASTVSYVLSGRRSISEPTRQRVHEAITALNYRPHAGARALASHRTNVIGLFAPLRPDVDVSVIMQFVAGVVTRARSHEHDVLVLTADDADGVERVAAGLVDALIVMDVESSDRRLPAMSRMAQPCILIGVPDDAHGLACVDFDFEQAGRLAIRHLAGQGGRRAALVGSPAAVLERHTSYADRMVRGVVEEGARLGLTVVARSSEASFAAGLEQMTALLADEPELDSVVVHNEAATDGVLTALARAGRRIGVDTHVVVVGPREMVARHGVSVATIDIPGRQIGSTAVDMAMTALGSSDHQTEMRLIAPRLETDGPVPGRPDEG
jgi:DNA-binding LacI/PurR family transcriptional regulator